MSTMTRGSLPPGVYWRRRGVAALVAITLVFGVGRLLAGGSDASDESASPGDTAAQAAADPRATPTAPSPSAGPKQNKKKNKKNRPSATPTPTPTPTPLAEPTGDCVDSDLVVTPAVPQAVAGSDVSIELQLRTNLVAACTWRVSESHVTLKVTSEGSDVWSTLDCPGPVPEQDVVVRREVTSTVTIVWGGKRSDRSCSALTDWALPGTYEVVAAAFGGEPSETTFVLDSPDPEVIVTTPKPKPEPKKNQKDKKKKKNQNQNRNQD